MFVPFETSAPPELDAIGAALDALHGAPEGTAAHLDAVRRVLDAGDRAVARLIDEHVGDADRWALATSLEKAIAEVIAAPVGEAWSAPRG